MKFTIFNTRLTLSSVFPLIGFQDPSTPFMEGIVDLHNFIFFYLILILLFVVSLLVSIMYNFYIRVYNPASSQDISLRTEMLLGSKILHGTVLEIVWTLIPSLILIIIVLPSFALMFSIDEVENFFITLKAIGHQWYWSYEYVIPFSTSEKGFDYTTINYDSYMKSEEDLQIGDLRLLEVDNPIVLPVKVPVRLLITAADVLHSWTIPSFGIKVDAVPGRLNQAPLFIKREGTFYGQCSELCGVNHAFMPIKVNTTTLYKFINWAGIAPEVNTTLEESSYTLGQTTINYNGDNSHIKANSPIWSDRFIRESLDKGLNHGEIKKAWGTFRVANRTPEQDAIMQAEAKKMSGWNDNANKVVKPGTVQHTATEFLKKVEEKK